MIVRTTLTGQAYRSAPSQRACKETKNTSAYVFSLEREHLAVSTANHIVSLPSV